MIAKFNTKFVNERSIALLKLRSFYRIPSRSNDNYCFTILFYL